MKLTTFLLAFSLVLLSGCAKDALDDENGDLKKAKVPIPMKAWFCMNPDFTQPLVHIEGLPDEPAYYLPGGGFISGHATHMGELITELCPSRIFDAVFDPSTGLVSYKTEGTITGDNGDHYAFTGIAFNNPDGTFYGTINMFDGTGKFKGMTGTVEMTGQGLCWTAVGFITYKK